MTLRVKKLKSLRYHAQRKNFELHRQSSFRLRSLDRPSAKQNVQRGMDTSLFVAR